MKTETTTLASLPWTETAERSQSIPEPAKCGPNEAESSLFLPCPMWKRALDACCVFFSLPLLLPVILVLVLWVKLTSRGPVLFRQKRVGHGGKLFMIYKFRSMRISAGTNVHTEHVQRLMQSNSKMTKLDRLGDSRFIPGGAILRMTGLDELPQLINVLKGEMSLVGPRPCLPEEFELYKPEHKKRFAVHPGLTGYWQVKGKNHTTFTEMIEMDWTYVQKRSLFLDVSILFQTPMALLKQVIDSREPETGASDSNGPE